MASFNCSEPLDFGLSASTWYDNLIYSQEMLALFTQILSQFIVNTTYKDLPKPVVAAAKRGVLDFVAVTLAGSREAVAEKITNLVKETKTNSEATVINGGFKTNAYSAAFVNGTIAHAMDYDDVLHIPPMWMGHPSVAIVPAALAVAEKNEVSGKEVILTYCQGIEIYAKVGLLCGDTAYRNGWHNTSIIGTMAAAGAAAKLLKLNELQVRRAFGIAASLASGLRQNFGTMVKPLHAGIAARNGVEAALLAETGVTSDENIFEAPLGFKNVFTGKHSDMSHEIPYGSKTITTAEFAKCLGNPWNILSPGMSFKICPSCRATHFGMDAASYFRQKYTVDARQISEIECHVPNHMESVLFYHNPQTGLEGKFSLEYVLARTLIDGTPRIIDFTDERVNEAKIKKLINKIKWISFEPEAGTFGTPEFIVTLKDGTKWHTKIEFPRGEPENPVNDDILIEKYQDCAGSILPQKIRTQVKDLIMNLESVENISRLTNLLGNFKMTSIL
jgi:2-methylcitrate dehydratase PrpD